VLLHRARTNIYISISPYEVLICFFRVATAVHVSYPFLVLVGPVKRPEHQGTCRRQSLLHHYTSCACTLVALHLSERHLGSGARYQLTDVVRIDSYHCDVSPELPPSLVLPVFLVLHAYLFSLQNKMSHLMTFLMTMCRSSVPGMSMTPQQLPRLGGEAVAHLVKQGMSFMSSVLEQPSPVLI
jgi:hypothetical protein